LAASTLLLLFIGLRIIQHLFERYLAFANKAYYSDAVRQAEAQKVLGLSAEGMSKTLLYSNDKYKFANFSSWISLVVTLVFLGFGGLGLFEGWAKQIAAQLSAGSIVTGLVFFGLIAVASLIFGLPFDYYRTFNLEERYGFNRQTKKGFFVDRIKGLLIGAVLGGLLLSLLLWIMEATGHQWWVFAWLALSIFSLLTAWLYPTFLAPLFNKFSPLSSGELQDKIQDLANRIGFQADGIFVMDASKRSSHGNAYFTGVGSKKRIVLFDTLIDSMSAKEVVAVLAHELGHFKLHHVRTQLIRGVLMTGFIFFLLSLCLPLTPFYQAFGLEGVSNYGALVVFSLWFGVVDFATQPLENYISRRNEFSADAFAKLHIGESQSLGSALLKLREKSHVMPISHPLFSRVYHSHPPLLERLRGMGYQSLEFSGP
jgi:STE24 endopeptidase